MMTSDKASRIRPGRSGRSPLSGLAAPACLTVQDWDRMQQLLVMRAEGGELSVIERRIADYIVTSGHLLRDQTSQQVATALAVSQSSVVKFAKRLGFRGYPDLKLSITEALARAQGQTPVSAVPDDIHLARAECLSRLKLAADDETRSLNASQTLADVGHRLAAADTVFVAAAGLDGLAAQGFADRLSLLGRRSVPCLQPATLHLGLSAAGPGDFLLLIGERSSHPEWIGGCRVMRSAGGQVAVITRQRHKPLMAVVDACLVVSAHTAEDPLATIVYESALRQVLDDLFLRLLDLDSAAAATFAANRNRCLDGG